MIKLLYGLKIAIAAILAIVVANLLNLDFSISAGIVAILSVGKTKKETVKTVLQRLLAFIVAILISLICFNIIGYNYIAFFIFLLSYIILCKFRNWGSAMAVNSVLISHFLTFKEMNFTTITNEFLLFIIGALFGILVNLHLKANKNFIDEIYEEINLNIKKILYRMSQRITNEDLENYDGSCFSNINNLISNAKVGIKENYLNSFSNDQTDFNQIDIIEQEVHILYNIYKKLVNVEENLISTEIVSNYMLFLSEEYNKLNKEDLLKEFYFIKEKIRELVLPTNRIEFENRAKLYIVLEYIEEFLLIKKV